MRNEAENFRENYGGQAKIRKILEIFIKNDCFGPKMVKRGNKKSSGSLNCNFFK
jgi:hypothetical protein